MQYVGGLIYNAKHGSMIIPVSRRRILLDNTKRHCQKKLNVYWSAPKDTALMSEPHKGRVLETHFAKTHPEAELQVSGSVTRPADSGLTGHQSGVAPFADGQVHSSLTRDKSGSFVVLTGINHIRPATQNLHSRAFLDVTRSGVYFNKPGLSPLDV